MQKILSIIIPSYNMECYLSQCLDSLICTSMKDLDIIVVNDGSKDATLEIANRYVSQYPNSIRVIDKPNGNYGSCINAALKNVKGKYVKVLDADDSFMTSNLDEFIEYLKQVDSDLVISNYQIVDGDRNPVKDIIFAPSRQSATFEEVIPRLLRADFQMHAVTYKSSVFEALDYRQSEGLSYTDMEWMFLPMTRVESVSFFEKIVYKYLVGREGQTIDVGVSLKAISQTATVLEKMLMDYAGVKNTISPSHLKYLGHRFRIKVPSVYRIILLKQDDVKQWDRLKVFDSILAENAPDLYPEFDRETIRIIPFHFIKYWRKHYHGESLLPITLSSRIVRTLIRL